MLIAVFLILIQPPPDVEAQIDRKRQESYAVLAGAVKLHEESLARELKLKQQGASSELDVNFRRQALTFLRHDLAMSNDDADDAREQTRAIIKLREANLERLTKLLAGGAVSAALIDSARRQVANAKYILATEEGETDEAIRHLKAIVAICQEELTRVESAAKAGSASAAEVGLIRGRMAYAHYLLNHESDDESGKSVTHLRIVVAERENAASRMEKLLRAGAANRTAVAEAQHNRLWAKANLAIEEGDRAATRNILKQLVDATNENLVFLKTRRDPGTPELVAVTKAALADNELRLALSAHPDTPLRSLLRKPIHELDY